MFSNQCVSKSHGTSRFIDDISRINDHGKFYFSCKYICHKQLELKLEHQRENDIFQLIMIYLYISFLTNGINFFCYCTYTLSVEQYSVISIVWFNIFRISTNSSMYTKTDRFCARAAPLNGEW